MGVAERAAERCEQSIVHIKQALALSPRDPLSGLWHTTLGVAEICLVGLTRRLWSLSEQLTQGTDLPPLRLFGGS